MKEVMISMELLNAIVGYLATKPFSEVANLISETQRQVSSNQKPEVEEV